MTPRSKIFNRKLLAAICGAAIGLTSVGPVNAQTPGPISPIPGGGTDRNNAAFNLSSSVATGWNITSSSFNLNDFDLLTGSLNQSSVQFADTAAADVVVDLVANDQMAFETARLANEARSAAETRRKLEEARRAAAAKSYDGVPTPLAAAATLAAQDVERLSPGCEIDAPYLLANAKSESGDYWSRIDDDGVMRPALFATEPMRGGDTDNGFWDGRTDLDFAMGVSQFAPSTWDGDGGKYGTDNSGDGIEDPQNVFDAVLAAAWYFCDLANGQDLTNDRNAQLQVYGEYGGGYNWRNDSTAVASTTKKYDIAQGYRLSGIESGGGSTQVSVGPDGCPTSSPSNTIRGGSIDLATLCARSVAQARTPEGAVAIKWALRQLGVPYSQPRRNNEGYFDCSSLVTRAYQAAGVPIAPKGKNAPTTHSMLPRDGWGRAPWSIPTSTARPGDLVFPHEGHVTLALADGRILHSPATGDVVHIRGPYSNPLAVRRVDVAAAYANPWGG